VIDTPGMRELGLSCEDGSVDAAFPELEELAAACRFSDCSHESEPGCAVRSAIEEGRVDGARLESWRKLQREAAYERRRSDAVAARAEEARWKAIAKTHRGMQGHD
jgi:ribosome biogenesis GTPase